MKVTQRSLRSRTISPEDAQRFSLYRAEKATGLPVRFGYLSLLTACDKEGRFIYDPERLQAAVMPYDEVDFSKVLEALIAAGVIRVYQAEVEPNVLASVGEVIDFTEYQQVNPRETASRIPGPAETAPMAKMPDWEIIHELTNNINNPDLNSGRPATPLASEMPAPVDEKKAEEAAPAKPKAPKGYEKIKGSWFRHDKELGIKILCANEEDLSAMAYRIPLKGGDAGLSHEVVDAMKETFNQVDVEYALKTVVNWSRDNPAKQKTIQGLSKFINGWLAREQDRRTTQAFTAAQRQQTAPVIYGGGQSQRPNARPQQSDVGTLTERMSSRLFQRGGFKQGQERVVENEAE